MRIISGSARGRKLQTLEGLDVRPTTDRVKESIFNIIQFDVPGCKFLDLFAGSGQMGIEALSRGASSCVFNDQRRETQQVIKDNLQTCGLYKQARVISMDAFGFLANYKDTFDIIFLDPPYNNENLPKILPLATKVTSETGLIVCEHLMQEEMPQIVNDFYLKKQYKYGKICISVYENIIQKNDD